MRRKIPTHKIVDLAAGRLEPEESLALLRQIEKDKDASRALDVIASLVDLVDAEGDLIFADEKEKAEPFTERLRALAARWLERLAGHPVLSGAAAFGMVFALFMIMLPPASPHAGLATLRDFDFGATVRGLEGAEVQAAFKQYADGDYGEAVKLLERYIRAFPRGEMHAYAHYAAGAAYLRWSEWNLHPLYVGFDRQRAEKGIEHLRAVIRGSSNARLLEDAHWLLAKASLMLEDVGQVRQELQILEAMRGSRFREAGEMLKSLEGL